MRDIDKVISALGSPVRREILALIWARELPAGDIADAFALTKPTISQHLAVLRDAGLVTMTAAGTSRRYRARQDALEGLRAALEGSLKWTPAADIPEVALSDVRTVPAVNASVVVDANQVATFRAFTEPEIYGRWLGVPVSIRDGRFAATMEFGTEVRGTYDIVSAPELIAMCWDFEDDNVPIPGRELVGYLRIRPRGAKRAHVEVHQLVENPRQAEFMEVAWGMVLGRLRAGVVAALNPSAPVAPRRRRSKTATPAASSGLRYGET
jgi:DNA-binding transcriptional ArsR family regulator/uncharacterized protein YndB with AHSA1/START domain